VYQNRNTNQMKTIFDKIHGFIDIEDDVLEFVDTFEFQRLRRIKQLGTACFVYPNASHTRFEHSLGVFFLAQKVVQSLQKKHPTLIDKSFEKCLTVAALCHDLGHLAYSHTSDNYIADTPHLFDKIGTHEHRSIEIFKKIVEKKQLEFYQFEIAMVCEMINPSFQKKDLWFYSILSNNFFDIDRADYVVRDSLNLGISVNFSKHDALRIINGMYIDERTKKICYAEKTKSLIQNLSDSRFTLHKHVYQHRVTIATAEMVRDIFELTFHIDWQDYLHIDDSIIFYLPHLHGENSPVAELVDRLNERDLYYTRVVQTQKKSFVLKHLNPEFYTVSDCFWQGKEKYVAFTLKHKTEETLKLFEKGLESFKI